LLAVSPVLLPVFLVLVLRVLLVGLPPDLATVTVLPPVLRGLLLADRSSLIQT
jgi:hypothetical protein